MDPTLNSWSQFGLTGLIVGACVVAIWKIVNNMQERINKSEEDSREREDELRKELGELRGRFDTQLVQVVVKNQEIIQENTRAFNRFIDVMNRMEEKGLLSSKG